MKKIVLVIVLTGVLFSTVFVTRAALLKSYASFFTVETATKGADALVMLAGEAETRLPRVLELYTDGYAPLVLLTEVRQPNGLAQRIGCDYYTRVQAMLDVVQASLPLIRVPSRKGGATSTFDEAYDLREYCLKHDISHLIIVTDNSHTRRALYAFNKVFKGTGILIEAAGASNSIFNESNWWKTDRGISAYVMESIKYAVYMFSSRNAPAIENS